MGNWSEKHEEFRSHQDLKQDGPTPIRDLPPTSQLKTIMSDGPDLGCGNGRDLRCGFRPTFKRMCVKFSLFLHSYIYVCIYIYIYIYINIYIILASTGRPRSISRGRRAKNWWSLLRRRDR